MNLSGEMIFFVLLSFTTIGCAILLLTLKKVVHMVLAIVFTFLGIAGIYITLSAEFVAAVQVLIYSGAVTIMMLFGIMLTRHDDKEQSNGSAMRKIFVLAGILAFAGVVYAGIYNLDIPSESVALHESNTEQIGVELYSKYVIPFELMSILLLVALMGAVIIAKRDDEESDEK